MKVLAQTLAMTLAIALAAAAARAEDRPAQLRDVAFDQRLGDAVPLDVPFRDEDGKTVTLRDYAGKPMLLVPAYYTCPMLCTLVLNGVVSMLRALPFDAGDEFTVVTFSFDPNDGPEAAAAKKATYVGEYRRRGAEGGWHFLTGDAASIEALTKAIGFGATWGGES
jgi:protein SCO1/2